MSKKNIILLIIAVVFFILAFGFCIYFNFIKVDNNSYDINYNEESKTSDIENIRYSPIVLTKKDGTQLDTAELDGYATVLFFFDKNNEESVEVLNKLDKMYEKYKNVIKFLPVNTALEYEEDFDKNYSFEIYYDFYKETGRNYNITSYPSIVFIQKDEQVFQAKEGFISDDALEANLDIISENF